MHYSEEDKIKINDNFNYLFTYDKNDILLEKKILRNERKKYFRIQCEYCKREFDVRSDYKIKKCKYCCNCYENSFAHYLEIELKLNINDVWDFELNNKNPYLIYKSTHDKIWIKCSKHGSYISDPGHFKGDNKRKGTRCPKCANELIGIDKKFTYEYIKEYIPDFDVIEFYENLEKAEGYVLVRSNERIDHVIGELYDVDERIKESYYKLKCFELLLFFSITNFSKNNSLSLSKSQIEIVESVKNDLISNLDSKITIDELSSKYGISKTSLKNCFKEVYGKPIFKWRKEYKLDYACRLIEEDDYSISEISKIVGYASPSKFGQAFKEYVGCTPSEYKN